MNITRNTLKELVEKINEQIGGNLELYHDVRCGYSLPTIYNTKEYCMPLCSYRGMTTKEMYAYLNGILNTIRYFKNI